ncbi:NAD(P)/FAD-dependent oxidoreductase [Edaphobacter modestus]|uniref:Flavin-dependent dehydrogenase n=1 Tax=Edaphobacter modestus TaxID=388466 RepID=A0A4Q7YRV8_9BACT|nr:NAD(P)/FAD-dependent oxidoreductase [Edaphobacter modestus]RZU40260.1 flavin-dependent dehydrogenase [Edaphobacter modestus]
MLKTDVFVCGGGPAGLAAAIAARRQGLDVMVADCFKPRIDKACGEGLMPDGLAALAALGVTPTEEETGTFHGIRFVEDGRSVEARFPEGVGRGIRRTVLHDLLHQNAMELGVKFRWSTQVLNVRDGVVRAGSEEIRTNWLVGADGIRSRVREWSGLGGGRRLSRRIGLRQHFKIRPWGEFMEIYWCNGGQAYMTPTGKDEVCVVVVASHRVRSVREALASFPELASRLKGAEPVSTERGALTEGHLYDRVTAGHTALIGDASGSVDAISGQGLALSFLQAEALGIALKSGDLRFYEAAHRRIRRVPLFMSRTMLLMDRFGPLRRWTQGAFEKNPRIFEQMLSVHVGATPLTTLGIGGILSVGIQTLMQQEG